MTSRIASIPVNGAAIKPMRGSRSARSTTLTTPAKRDILAVVFISPLANRTW